MILAGTGHRPGKVFSFSQEDLIILTKFIKEKLEQLQPDQVISGLALGFDTALALAAIKSKIPLIAAVPCDGQASKWNVEAQKIYKTILDNSSQVVVINPGVYEFWKMGARNAWMVNHATHVLALWNGDEKGGTANCIKYAQRTHKPIINIYEDWIKFFGSKN